MVVVIFSFCSSLYVYMCFRMCLPPKFDQNCSRCKYEFTHMSMRHIYTWRMRSTPKCRLFAFIHISNMCVWSRRVACVVVHICVCTSIITTTKSSKFICILHKYVCMFEILSSFYRRSRIRRVDQSLAMFVVRVCETMTHDIFSSTFCLHKNAFTRDSRNLCYLLTHIYYYAYMHYIHIYAISACQQVLRWKYWVQN